MRLPLKREACSVQSRVVSIKRLELETAKEILSEVFHVRLLDVEEMIHGRLEERTGVRRARKGYDLRHSALVSSYGPELQKHGRKRFFRSCPNIFIQMAGFCVPYASPQ